MNLEEKVDKLLFEKEGYNANSGHDILLREALLKLFKEYLEQEVKNSKVATFVDLIPKDGRPVQVWREGKHFFVADPENFRKEILAKLK